MMIKESFDSSLQNCVEKTVTKMLWDYTLIACIYFNTVALFVCGTILYIL